MLDRLDGPGSSEEPGRRILSPVCLGCARLVEGTETCEAFPNRIPDAIWNGHNTHRRPYPGDRGIVYEPLLEASRGLPAG